MVDCRRDLGPTPARACLGLLSGRRHRVLVMDACTPTPDRDSGSLRMLALMRALRDNGELTRIFQPYRITVQAPRD